MHIRLFLFVALLLVVNLFTTSIVYALDLTSIRFGMHNDRERAVIELSDTVEFRAFVMPNPNRIVVDMKSFNWKTNKINYSNNSIIKDVRYGPLGNGQGRLVFETNQPVMVKSAFIIPKANGQKDRLVIDFSVTSNETMHDVGTQVIGKIKPQPNKAEVISPVTTSNKPKTSKKPLIVIDPGHGGQDPGAIGANGIYEKTIVLAVGLELKKQLENAGYNVKMTRNNDVFIPLRGRVMFARKHKADLFISLHADSIRDSSVTGASVYTLSDKASDVETEKLAERENKSDLIAGIDLSNQENDIAEILIDIAARDTMNQSRYLAGSVLNNFNSNGVKIIDNNQRSAGFAVLKAMDIPSVLVEMGYVTNISEVNRLSSPIYRQKIAAALKQSVDNYYQKIAQSF